MESSNEENDQPEVNQVVDAEPEKASEPEKPSQVENPSEPEEAASKNSEPLIMPNAQVIDNQDNIKIGFKDPEIHPEVNAVEISDERNAEAEDSVNVNDKLRMLREQQLQQQQQEEAEKQREMSREEH